MKLNVIQRVKNKKIGMALAFIAVVGACSSYDFGKVEVDEVIVKSDSTDPWENGVKLLMKVKCNDCHYPDEKYKKFQPGTADTAKARIDFTDKVKFEEIAENIKLRVFDSQPPLRMPLDFGNPLTDQEKAGLKSYVEAVIKKKAEKSGANKPVADGTTALKYDDVKGFVTKYCAGCHPGTAPHSFATLADIKQNNIFVRMKIRMQDSTSPMPTSGRVDSEPDGAKLLEWLKAGADLYD
jgi:hypothetical protein